MTGDRQQRPVMDAEVVDPKTGEILSRTTNVTPGHELAEVSEPDQLTGEGYYSPIPRAEPVDPKEAIKRMHAYTEMCKVRAVEIMKRRAFAVSLTNEHHWNNIEGSPYLNKAGSSLLQRVFRVAVRDRACKQTWHEDELGRFYQYEFEALFDAGGDFDCVYALGTRNQRARFFAKKKEVVKDENGNAVMEKSRDGKKEYPKRETVWRDLSEIDPGNIKKSAWTNCLVNGIQGLLALDGITWEELEELTAGRVSADKCQQVSFGSRDATGKVGPATEPQVKLLWARSKAAGEGCMEALCKHLNLETLRSEDGTIHVLFDQVNPALKFIDSWKASASTAASQEQNQDRVTKQEAEHMQKGKDVLNISDGDWKKKWGNLPHLMPRKLFDKASAWLRETADGGSK